MDKMFWIQLSVIVFGFLIGWFCATGLHFAFTGVWDPWATGM